MQLIYLYKQLKRQHPHVSHDWWPVSGKFRPAELEIVIGALLTQNTNWRNVKKALSNLTKAEKLTAESIVDTPLPMLRQLVKPSGFYRQKAKRLRDLCKFISSYDVFYGNVTREQLLALKGVGKETADSILLYACNKPFFVVDAYTRRFLERNNMKTGKYDDIREIFEKSIRKNVNLYKEFHALIVENEKLQRTARLRR